jgi:hypothetical protein
MNNIAKVIYPNGVVKYTSYTTVTDWCLGVLSDRPEDVSDNASSADVRTNPQIVEVKVPDYDSWFAIASDNQLLFPLTPSGDDNVSNAFEGLLDRNIIHLRTLNSQGMACCGHEFESAPTKRFIFSEGLRYQSTYNNHELLEGDIFKLSRNNKLCFECLSSVDVRKIAHEC